MDITPTKEQNFGTEDDINELDFNHLHVSQHHYKRTIEGSPFLTGDNHKRIDIKSTPDIFRFKQDNFDGDENPSHLLPYNREGSSLNTSTPIKHEALSYPSSPENKIPPISGQISTAIHYQSDTGGNLSGGGGKSVLEKVFVITSGTDKGAQHHTTAGHQENAQRTALLSGTGAGAGGDSIGCLYRPRVSPALVWADSVRVPAAAASMADILRSVCSLWLCEKCLWCL